MFTFYLVRHGKTEYNKQNRMMGSILDTPLVKSGYQDAKSSAKHLKGINLSHIYSSDLGRAYLTAYLIRDELQTLTPVTSTKKLRETNYGIYTNNYRANVMKIEPNYRKKADFVFPEGESYNQMQKRVVEFVLSLEEKHQNEHILIAAHRGTARALISYFKNEDFEKNLRMFIPHDYVGKFQIDIGKLVKYEDLGEKPVNE